MSSTEEAKIYTTEQAKERMSGTDIDNLQSMCCDMHKDFYGSKGRHFFSKTKEECLEWFHNHYKWNEELQVWNNSMEFLDEQGPSDYLE